MKLRELVLAGAGALLLGGVLAPASAAPGLPSGLKPTATENSAVEQVHYRYRRCWRHHGHLHCRRVARRNYGGAYYSYGGPRLGLYFGGHRHWGHRHWRRW